MSLPHDRNYPPDAVQCDHCGGWGGLAFNDIHVCKVCDGKGWLHTGDPNGRFVCLDAIFVVYLLPFGARSNKGTSYESMYSHIDLHPVTAKSHHEISAPAFESFTNLTRSGVTPCEIAPDTSVVRDAIPALVTRNRSPIFPNNGKLSRLKLNHGTSRLGVMARVPLGFRPRRDSFPAL